MSEKDESWLSSRKTTNQLLGFIGIVLAAGFVNVGEVGSRSMQTVSELLLVVLLVAAVSLFTGVLLGD